MTDDLVYRLRKRAEIRRQIDTRKSVQEGRTDRIADLLEEAAECISNHESLRLAAWDKINELEDAVEAEPVAWMWKDGSLTTDPDYADGTWQPLYTAPPVSDYHEGWEEGFKAAKREWVGLTDDDIDDLWKRDYFHLHYEFPKTIELILKEKNCG